MANSPSDLKVMANDIKHISADIADIKSTLRGNYVTKAEFEPVRNIAYGLVGLVMVVVVGALLGLVVMK